MNNDPEYAEYVRSSRTGHWRPLSPEERPQGDDQRTKATAYDRVKALQHLGAYDYSEAVEKVIEETEAKLRGGL